ncbi:hypothetical protein DW843_06705 [Ruminococcus sp. AM36-18]|jgi:hypothetical protein|uniref:hypothetical protein n=1 Tax=Ruminococcus bromii TaxID=40518 RepID=UPI000E4F48AE|nr:MULTISPECIES: hypothetical protein [Ruminococcus]RGH57676.1 hypothetical protein DW843_06705 [Ruminococcus sp. AM36-18]
MKKIQKKLSVVLAVMMVLCMFTALPFSASAAETSEETSAGNKINVTSNVTDPVSYDYNAQTEQVVVTYLLKADHMIVDTQSSLTYDSKVLKLASTTTTNTKNKVFPVFQSSIVWNPSLTNQVLFNCSSLDLFNFKSENVYCTFTFDVVGSGDTTVNLNVDYLTGTEADTYDELFESDKKDIDYIYNSANKVAGAAFTANAVLVQGEEPTTAPQPTTATQPTTVTQPTTAPATKPTQPATEPTQPQSGVSVTGDIALPLADDGNGIYTGSTELEAGSYTFKMSVNGVAFGNGSTFTDKTTNATYNSKWTSSTTLKATGGKYTFKFNTAKNTLTIEYLAPSKASIVGDINLDLQATKDANVYSASVKLNKGNYEFRVMNQGVRYCCGYTYKDLTVGSQYNSKWSSASTLAASGGTYTFSYDIDTNKLTISYLPSGAEVSVVGNFTLALAKTDKENVYSGTKTLKAGNYQIKMNNYGKLCGTSAVVKDVTPGLVFNPKWSKYTTFVATGGTYTFTYNTATNTLVVTADKGDIPVKVTGDINLSLKKSDTNVFTGSVKLKKGDYSFKMNVNGTDFCNGTTIRNATTGTIKYNSKYTSASTLVAVGGTYTFAYNTLTNQLSVKYSK